eukprot:GHVS01023949.1.p3 GENE.GHVS01023949.1~~GHVS01023949.1.p3  ORF type:complete len:102 (+),score=16.69 GHVS01023949.1:406-711(+)
MGLKCFVYGPVALVIYLIPACLADASLRSSVRQLSNERNDLSLRNVVNPIFRKTEWMNEKKNICIKVQSEPVEGGGENANNEGTVTLNGNEGRQFNFWLLL